MGELKNEDMYLISAIIDKSNFAMPLREKVIDGKAMKKNDEEYGLEILTGIVKKLHLVKDEVNLLISRILEKDISEVCAMSLKETIGVLKGLLGKEGMGDFFK